jgi:Xaa-Pro aminopeptidase
MVDRIRELSLNERDRRYKLVREEMERRGFDCLVIWGDCGKWDTKFANIYYLTQIGGNGEVGTCIFPKEGEPTVFVWAIYMIDEWLNYQSWVKDVRSSRVTRWARPYWSDAVIGRIKELKLENGRIGVVGLEGTELEGDIPYVTYKKILEGLPNATFENATDLIENIRLIKSEEELGCIEKASTIGDLAAEEMYRKAKIGASEEELFADMIRTMLVNGSEYPIMFLWSAGKYNRAKRLTYNKKRKLRRGDVILTEYSPRYRGYYSHLQRPICIGKPDRLTRDLYEASVESFYAGLSVLKPGITLEEICKKMYEPIERRGFVLYPGVLFHGMGLYWDRPHGTPFLSPEAARTELKEGMVLAFEPGASDPDLKRGIHVGHPVVVTTKGCRELSKAKVELKFRA